MALPTPSIRFHDYQKPSQFGVGVQWVKNGSNAFVNIESMVTNVNLYTSLNTMSMAVTLTMADAAGAMSTYAIQPGDQVRVVILNSLNDDTRLDVTLTVISIGDVDTSENRKIRSYTVTAIDKSSVLNKKSTVSKGYNQTVSSIVQDIAGIIGIDSVDAETTVGAINFIGPMLTAHACINKLYPWAVSEKYGPGQQFYFYQDTTGFHFKSIAGIIADAKAKKIPKFYTQDANDVSVDKKYKILDLKHENYAGGAFINPGAMENELVRFNHLNRTITSHTKNYKQLYKSVQLMGKNPMLNLDKNFDEWVTDPAIADIGQRAHTTYGSDPTAYGLIDTPSQNYNQATMQANLFNQILYHMVVTGNATLGPGQLIHVVSSQVAGVTEPQMDSIITGDYLVVNAKHSVLVGEEYLTFLDVVTDSQNVDVFSKGKLDGAQ